MLAVVVAAVGAGLAFARTRSAPVGTGVVVIETDLAYEGGQHLYTSTDLPWGQAGIDAQKNPLMANCYAAMLDGCKAMDMRVYMAYNSVMPTTRYGAWGALEYQDSPISGSPKMTTLLKYTTRR